MDKNVYLSKMDRLYLGIRKKPTNHFKMEKRPSLRSEMDFLSILFLWDQKMAPA